MFGSSRTALAIRSHVTLLVACCALGGVALAGGILLAALDIEARVERQHQDELALQRFEELTYTVGEWFATTDQVLGGDSFRIDSALRQAEELERRAGTLRKSPLLAGHVKVLDDLASTVRVIQEIVMQAANPRVPFNTIQRWELSQRVEHLSLPIVAGLEDCEGAIRFEAKQAGALAERHRARVKLAVVIASSLYLLAVLWAWRWTSRTLVRPLQLLTKSAVVSIDQGEPVPFTPTGPREVRLLAKHFSTLVATLQVARDEMHTEAVETEALLQSVPAVLIGVGPAGEIVRWNAGASRSLGLLPSQALGRTLRECPLPWVDRQTNDRIADLLGSDETRTLNDVFYQDGRGHTRILNATITPIDYGDQGVGFLFLGTDVTDQKGLEKQLRHAQKLESVGQLAAGVAHEINTPIQYVGHSIHFLRDAFSDLQEVLDGYRALLSAVSTPGSDSEALLERVVRAEEEADLELLEEEVPGAIDRAIEGIQRVSSIVVAMKQFAHPGGKEMAPADLNEALKTTLTVAKNEYRYVAEVVTDFEDIPLVTCNQGDMNQVFLNLIVNASHAIEERVAGTDQKGLITLRTRLRGENVEIEVEDTGNGIPNEVAERIFDPFFTTKAVGKGTGQGLSIVHSLVSEKHGGSIRFRSKVGVGTTFLVTLPIRRAMERSLAA